jgi:CubicO group peptidase (beta-lactamase class C family)
MSVSVVRSDKTLFEGGYRATDIETRKPVSENTLFGIASLSKGFASTLLVKLLEEKTK